MTPLPRAGETFKRIDLPFGELPSRDRGFDQQENAFASRKMLLKERKTGSSKGIILYRSRPALGAT